MGNLPRVGARGAVLLPIEGGLYICSLGGRAGDYPPDNVADFLEFAKSLPQPTMYETLRDARFVSGVARMIYPANRLRHYERSATLPRALDSARRCAVQLQPDVRSRHDVGGAAGGSAVHDVECAHVG